MKVTVDEFKAAMAIFQSEFISSMKTSVRKFITGAVLAASGKQIDQFLSPFVGEDGMIETDAVKGIIAAGMDASGGALELPIQFGMFSVLGAAPIDISIRREDVDKFFDQTIPSVARRQ